MNPDPPTCLSPDPNPTKPVFVMPPGACDCHAHICGPAAEHGYVAERLYTPTECLIGDYERLLNVLGVSRAVLVQPSFYGADNGAMLGAMKTATVPVRGVAVLAEQTTNAALEAMHEAGVRGVRFNIVDIKTAKGVLPIEKIRAVAERIAPFGWHIEFLMHVDEFADLDQTLGNLPVNMVFGHLGYVKTDKGVTSPGFQALLRLLAGGRAWVKFTGPYRISTTSMPHHDTDAFAQQLVDTAPERIVWGTDWPHVMAKWSLPMPNDGKLTDLLARWAPDAATRLQILVENPVALYGFPAA